MRSAVVGFPRIGEHRELKFATEKYFAGEIGEVELASTAGDLRASQWKTQKAAGVDFIPSNDYSLYDGTLDTVFMLNAIPERYTQLGLSDLDTYFAMARGYQGDKGDVKAYTMKKWFNTNYHYMVPELDDDMDIHLRSNAFLDGYKQASDLDIGTKPVVIGPYTFLQLARLIGSKTKQDYVPALIAAYTQILDTCAKEGVQWLQIDEPALVLDMSEEDIKLFRTLYEGILLSKQDVHVLLQTYFGDVRDCYKDICALPWDGIGLDFVEGGRNRELLKKHGFPQDKTLFAGRISGKNVWRADYPKVLEDLRTLRKIAPDTVLSTSCSLLHVSYTILNEEKLPPEVTERFAFAYEKLTELRELADLIESEDPTASPVYKRNADLFTDEKAHTNEDVQKRVAALTDEDFSRNMPRKARREVQKEQFGLPLLPTTTIGSFPQTSEVKANRARYRKGQISESEYRERAKQFIADCIRLQEEIGLDVLVHGEFERNDMVEFFGENLTGYVFTENGWVQSYGTRSVKPPIIFGDISREKSITADYIRYANSLTDKDAKGMLTGPVTILNWSFPREDIPAREMMYQIALAIREEVLELEQAGVRIIQIDEAALREKLPLRREDWHSEYLDAAIKAFRLCHAKVKPQTQIHTHMCYSEFEDIVDDIDDMDADVIRGFRRDCQKSLDGAAFRLHETFGSCNASGCRFWRFLAIFSRQSLSCTENLWDVITFEASRSKLDILDSLREHGFETEVGPGVYDIHSPRVPTVEEMENALQVMLSKIPKEHLWVNPDCGLKTRQTAETVQSLRNLVQAARNVREQLGD